MVSNLTRLKLLWEFTTLLTLIAALIGVLRPAIYDRVIDPSFAPAAFAQDLLTVVICLILLVLIATTGEGHLRRQVVIMGVIASFWYLYGIFVIERVYNWVYYLYLAIFAFAFWSTAYGMGSLRREQIGRTELPRAMRLVSAWFAIAMALVFILLWGLQLAPLLREGQRIEYLYSIYILDLCFVMPAFIMSGVMSLRRRPIGWVLAPGLFIMGFFVIFPLGLGEVAKPFFGRSADVAAMLSSFLLSAAFIVLTALQLRFLRVGESGSLLGQP